MRLDTAQIHLDMTVLLRYCASADPCELTCAVLSPVNLGGNLRNELAGAVLSPVNLGALLDNRGATKSVAGNLRNELTGATNSPVNLGGNRRSALTGEPRR